jgi:hypothetical protein
MAKREPLYTAMVRAGKATYFIDVRKTEKGHPFVDLTESTFINEERKRNTIRIWRKETMENVLHGLQDAEKYLPEDEDKPDEPKSTD